MTKFVYRAISAAGEPQDGRIDAPSKTRAAQMLQQRGLVVLSVESAESSESFAVASRSIGGRISNQQLMEFSSEMSALLDANIPLEQVLKTQADLCRHPAFKEVLTDVWKDVNGGASCADALARHPKVFERFYCNMVRGGEASGTLDLIMRRVAGLLERRQKLRSKVVSAMIYPSILIVMGVGVVAIMMLVVIPKLSDLFSDGGRLLPTSTRLIIAMSDSCRVYWWTFPLLLVVLFAGFKAMTRSEAGKVKWGLNLLKLPVLGQLLAEAEASRFCRMLSALLAGQVPILQALSITGGTLGNAALRSLMAEVYEAVQAGMPMGGVLQRHPEFPELASRMITMGEDSGELTTMLDKVAERYEEKVNASTERFVSVLEPIFTVAMGVVVGFIVISMMQGIMAMSTSAG